MSKTPDLRRKNPVSWGHLKFAESFYKPVLAQGRSGLYDTGDYGPLFHRYLCDCGRELEWDARMMPNKRLVTACGHPDCEFSRPKEKAARVPKAFRDRKPPKPPKKKRVIIGGRSMTFYVPTDLVAAIEAYAEAHDVSKSRACVDMLRVGARASCLIAPDA